VIQTSKKRLNLYIQRLDAKIKLKYASHCVCNYLFSVFDTSIVFVMALLHIWNIVYESLIVLIGPMQEKNLGKYPKNTSTVLNGIWNVHDSEASSMGFTPPLFLGGRLLCGIFKCVLWRHKCRHSFLLWTNKCIKGCCSQQRFIMEKSPSRSHSSLLNYLHYLQMSRDWTCYFYQGVAVFTL